MITSRFAGVVPLSPEVSLLFGREKVSGKSGLWFDEGRLVEEEHVFYYAFLQNRVGELFVGRVLGVRQKLFDANMLICEDNARAHASI